MSTEKNEVTTLEVSDNTAASDAPDPIKKRIFSNIFTKKFLIILLAGQFLSFCITVTIITNGALADRGANFPTTVTLLNYVLLFIVYAPKAIYEKGFRGWIEAFRTNWWRYLLFSFSDVEGNYFVVKAYQYTSILSIMLLDTWTTPCVVILSLIFLRVKYRWTHYVAVLICLIGIGAVVGGDLQTGNQGDMFKYVNLALGDVFCLISSTCYAVSNVTEEYLVKQKRPLYEIVSQLGLLGIIISVIQIAIFERDEVAQSVWTKEIIGLVIAYNIAMFCLYTVVPLLFRRASATFFNLSLLTSDFYTLIFAIILFQAKIHALYPVAFIGTMVGLVLFNLYQPEERENEKDDEEEAKDESNKDNIKE